MAKPPPNQPLRRTRVVFRVMLLLFAAGLFGWYFGLFRWINPAVHPSARKKPMPSEPERIAGLILEGARGEAAKRTPYVMEYREIAYPMGDVPEGTGVCTDLIVRAFRNAGIDLQELIYEDRKAYPEAYPKPAHFWQSNAANSNIDHRRCRNMAVWFERFTESMSTDITDAAMKNWQAGDVVFFGEGRDKPPSHVAIVSDLKHSSGMPYLMDSKPPGASDRRSLNQYSPKFIHSHFRVTDPSRLQKDSGGNRGSPWVVDMRGGSAQR